MPDTKKGIHDDYHFVEWFIFIYVLIPTFDYQDWPSRKLFDEMIDLGRWAYFSNEFDNQEQFHSFNGTLF